MTRPKRDLQITRWGPSPAVLIHGGTPGGGADAFKAQQPLAARRELVLPDRPGHGGTPGDGREDFEADAAAIVEQLGSGRVHLTGHSGGGLVALYIAGRHPDLVASLTLIEPPAYWLAPEDPDVVAMSSANQDLVTRPPRRPSRDTGPSLRAHRHAPAPGSLGSFRCRRRRRWSALRRLSSSEQVSTSLGEAGWPCAAAHSPAMARIVRLAIALYAALGVTYVGLPHPSPNTPPRSPGRGRTPRLRH